MAKIKRMRETDNGKTCLWCGQQLAWHVSSHGIVDRTRAHCKTCDSNIFVFGKTQYKPLTKKQYFERKANQDG